MAANNNEQVGKALDLLRRGLQPFVQRELTSALGDRHAQDILTARNRYSYNPVSSEAGSNHVDCQVLLNVMWEQWNEVFRTRLSPFERNLVSELRMVRNRWAHQEPFSTDDAYRALDSAARLLSAVSAPDGATEVERMKKELFRQRHGEQPRHEVRQPTVRKRTRGSTTEEYVQLAGLVRAGEWTTYGDISMAARGDLQAARAVGQAANKHPSFPTPHRVLQAGGMIPDGWRDQDGNGPDVCRRRLEAEGVTFRYGKAGPRFHIGAELLRRRAQGSPRE